MIKLHVRGGSRSFAKTSAKQERTMSRKLAWSAVALFLLAQTLPAFVMPYENKPMVVWGLEATFFSFVFGLGWVLAILQGDVADPVGGFLDLFLGGAANALFVATLVLSLWNRRLAMIAAWIAASSALTNVVCLWNHGALGEDFTPRIGCWVWLASMLLLALSRSVPARSPVGDQHGESDASTTVSLTV